jgi:probable rRNA maturation factor
MPTSSTSARRKTISGRFAVQYTVPRAGLPAASRFHAWARAALERSAEVTLRIVDEEEGRALNRQYRGKDKATNVLTFAYVETEPLSGDIALCAPVVAREAKEQSIALDAHFAHLTVHGMLHLQGYDHENDRDASVMEARESCIVMSLGYPDPYGVRSAK